MYYDTRDGTGQKMRLPGRDGTGLGFANARRDGTERADFPRDETGRDGNFVPLRIPNAWLYYMI